MAKICLYVFKIIRIHIELLICQTNFQKSITIIDMYKNYHKEFKTFNQG